MHAAILAWQVLRLSLRRQQCDQGPVPARCQLEFQQDAMCAPTRAMFSFLPWGASCWALLGMSSSAVGMLSDCEYIVKQRTQVDQSEMSVHMIYCNLGSSCKMQGQRS